MKPDESDLFIASHPAALNDFLKTNIANNKHIYCSFDSQYFCYSLGLDLNRRKVLSISFQDARTLYPPFKRP